MDIMCTTPRSEMANAAKEAADVLEAGGGSYFRYLSTYPKRLECGDRIFYVENGYVTGYCIVSGILCGENAVVCDTTGRTWSGTTHLCMDASSWHWIRKIPKKGFRGWRYKDFAESEIEVVGDWRSERP